MNLCDLSVRVRPSNGRMVARCEELDIHVYGDNQQQARRRLKFVIDFYCEAAVELGYNVDVPGLSDLARSSKVLN